MKSNYLRKSDTSLGLAIVCAIVAFTISALLFGWIIMIAWNGILAGLLGATTMSYGQGVSLWIVWALVKPNDSVYRTFSGDDE